VQESSFFTIAKLFVSSWKRAVIARLVRGVRVPRLFSTLLPLATLFLMASCQDDGADAPERAPFLRASKDGLVVKIDEAKKLADNGAAGEGPRRRVGSSFILKYS
jgi:hypothetical protein